jgi:hypothetical protein
MPLPIGAITKPKASMRAPARRGMKIKRWFGYGLHLLADTR